MGPTRDITPKICQTVVMATTILRINSNKFPISNPITTRRSIKQLLKWHTVQMGSSGARICIVSTRGMDIPTLWCINTLLPRHLNNKSGTTNDNSLRLQYNHKLCSQCLKTPQTFPPLNMLRLPLFLLHLSIPP